MVKGRLPGQTGAIFHFCLLRRISGDGKGLTRKLCRERSIDTAAFSIANTTAGDVQCTDYRKILIVLCDFWPFMQENSYIKWYTNGTRVYTTPYCVQNYSLGYRAGVAVLER